MALKVASRGDIPCSMWCSTASTTTIASSTTRPIASTRPNSDRVLIEKPSNGKNAKVPTSETGTASSGIKVARQPCRKMKTTMMTRMSASKSVLTISLIPSVTASVVSSEISVVEVLRESFLQILHQLLGAVHRVDRVGARQLVDGDDRGGIAVQPSDLVVVLRAQLHPGYILHPHDRAVRIGAHDDVAKLLRAQQSPLRSNRIGELLPAMVRARRRSGRRGSRCSALPAPSVMSLTVTPRLANVSGRTQKRIAYWPAPKIAPGRRRAHGSSDR